MLPVLFTFVVLTVATGRPTLCDWHPRFVVGGKSGRGVFASTAHRSLCAVRHWMIFRQNDLAFFEAGEPALPYHAAAFEARWAGHLHRLALRRRHDLALRSYSLALGFGALQGVRRRSNVLIDVTGSSSFRIHRSSYGRANAADFATWRIDGPRSTGLTPSRNFAWLWNVSHQSSSPKPGSRSDRSLRSSSVKCFT